MSFTLRREKASIVTMMNDFYKNSPDTAALPVLGATQSVACVETAEVIACPPGITDEEAELQLPGYALAFEEYHQRRTIGDSPEEALEGTLKEWRAMWRQHAFVPHRRL